MAFRDLSVGLGVLMLGCGPGSPDPGTHGSGTGSGNGSSANSSSTGDGGGGSDPTSGATGSSASETGASETGAPTVEPPLPPDDACQAEFMATGECPEPLCEIGCGVDHDTGCEAACYPTPCQSIPQDVCPLDRCQIMTNCAGEDVCFYEFTAGPPACGEEGYYGQDVECCAGLERACAGEGANGCDPYKGYLGMAICIDCGDGECSSVENPCNCPADC